MSFQFYMMLLIITFIALLMQPATSIHHPLIYDIRKRYNQCIYKRFERGDFATFEVCNCINFNWVFFMDSVPSFTLMLAHSYYHMFIIALLIYIYIDVRNTCR